METEINYIHGDLIELAKEGKFDVIAHGCNCMSTMGAGIAPQMAKAFGCDRFDMERRGRNINKLGNIDYSTLVLGEDAMLNTGKNQYLTVVNAYTQYNYGRNHSDGVSNPFDYEAFTMCMRKMNTVFKGKHIGLPKIGAGLAGGDWEKIEQIINCELYLCTVTIVTYSR